LPVGSEPWVVPFLQCIQPIPLPSSMPLKEWFTKADCRRRTCERLDKSWWQWQHRCFSLWAPVIRAHDCLASAGAILRQTIWSCLTYLDRKNPAPRVGPLQPEPLLPAHR
jgi:hypothetical protein